ncbi:MAG: glycosyltransferase, partial [Proteobacteria bacterium]
TNMLASGRPVIATADPGTGLADEVEGAGIVIPPGDAQAMADAIEQLIDDPERAASLGKAARIRAEERWSKDAIIGRFMEQVSALVPAAIK